MMQCKVSQMVANVDVLESQLHGCAEKVLLG